MFCEFFNTTVQPPYSRLKIRRALRRAGAHEGRREGLSRVAAARRDGGDSAEGPAGAAGAAADAGAGEYGLAPNILVCSKWI